MIAEIVLSTATKLQYCFKIVFNFKRHPQHDYYIGLKKKFKRCPQFVLYFKSRPQYDYYIGLRIIFLMCTSKLKKLHINQWRKFFLYTRAYNYRAKKQGVHRMEFFVYVREGK